MKYWLHAILIVVLGFLVSLYLNWWVVSIVSIGSAVLLRTRFWLSAMFGFLAGFILWAGYSTYLDIENQHLLSSKIAALFGLSSAIYLTVISGLLGGILAALGSMVGSSLRAPLPNK